MLFNWECGTDFNLADIQEAISDAVPNREAVVSSESRISWRELTDRTRRLANFFLSQGLSVRKERSELGNSEVGQDRVAVLPFNRPAFMETMLASFKARLAPCNVNYRYIASDTRPPAPHRHPWPCSPDVPARTHRAPSCPARSARGSRGPLPVTDGGGETHVRCVEREVSG